MTTPLASRAASALLVIAGAVALAAAAIWTTASATLPPNMDEQASPFAGANAQLSALMTSILQTGTLSDPQWQTTVRAAKQRPLDDRPFVVAAVRAIESNRTERAIALLHVAQQRAPRSVLARMLLLDRYLRADRPAASSEEIAALTRLLPRASTALADQMIGYAEDPIAAARIRPTLLRNPTLFNNVLIGMAQDGVAPATILRFAGADAPRSSDPRNWQAALITAQLKAKHYVEAKQLWTQFYRPVSKSAVYDASFDQKPLPEPFGWRFGATEGVGVANPEKGALSIRFYGRADGALSSQLLTLSAGAHRVKTSLSGAESGDGASIGWTLSCDGASAPFATMAPLKLDPAGRTLAMTITVPSTGCDAQWLRLMGFAGDFSSPLSARIASIEVN